MRAHTNNDATTTATDDLLSRVLHTARRNGRADFTARRVTCRACGGEMKRDTAAVHTTVDLTGRGLPTKVWLHAYDCTTPKTVTIAGHAVTNENDLAWLVDRGGAVTVGSFETRSAAAAWRRELPAYTKAAIERAETSRIVDRREGKNIVETNEVWTVTATLNGGRNDERRARAMFTKAS